MEKYKDVIMVTLESTMKLGRDELSLYERAKMVAENFIGDKDEAELFAKFIKNYYE